MFKLRYSKKASILEWDNHSFDCCRPCEADAIADEIIELVQSLEVSPQWLQEEESLPLEKANGEARLVCETLLLEALGGFPNLPHAEDGWDEYKSSDKLNLESWGDEEVTDANLTKNKDGTVSYEAHTIHFADPYGGLFNVVKLVIKVDVVQADDNEAKWIAFIPDDFRFIHRPRIAAPKDKSNELISQKKGLLAVAEESVL